MPAQCLREARRYRCRTPAEPRPWLSIGGPNCPPHARSRLARRRGGCRSRRGARAPCWARRSPARRFSRSSCHTLAEREREGLTPYPTGPGPSSPRRHKLKRPALAVAACERAAPVASRFIDKLPGTRAAQVARDLEVPATIHVASGAAREGLRAVFNRAAYR